MLALILIVAAVALLLVLVARISARRHVTDDLVDPSTLASPPARPAPTVDTSAPHAPPVTAARPGATAPVPGEPGRATLPALLEDVRFPDDLLPLTHGLSVADIDWRLVLVTRADVGSVHDLLGSELSGAGFAVAWEGQTKGQALRADGSISIELHPPVSREVAEQLGEAERPRKRGRQSKGDWLPRRPDFPSAPLEATVVELTVL